MPLQRCSKNGRPGWKYGTNGTCYTGPGAKQKAEKQGIAINLSEKKAGKTPEWDKSTVERVMDNLGENE